jgi:hypothetical protein
LLFLLVFSNGLINVIGFDRVDLFVIREDIITAFIVAKKNSDALKANSFSFTVMPRLRMAIFAMVSIFLPFMMSQRAFYY